MCVSADVRPQLCGRRRHLIGFGDRVQVLDPQLLRARVHALAEQVVALYGRQGLPALVWRE